MGDSIVEVAIVVGGTFAKPSPGKGDQKPARQATGDTHSHGTQGD